MKLVICKDNSNWNGTIGKEYEVIKQDTDIRFVGKERRMDIFYTIVDDLGNKVDINIRHFE